MSDELKQFAQQRRENIDAYADNQSFKSRSLDWTLEAMRERYVYNFDWLGRPIIQYPQDIQAMQEIVWATRPDYIIETGIAHGGSLALSASLLGLLDLADAAERGEMVNPRKPKRQVIGIDIDIRAHNRELIEAHPFFGYMTLIEGSSVDDSTYNEVLAVLPENPRVMVCLDSNHTHEHVLAELNLYAQLVPVGLYCVVLDTFIEDAPVDFIQGRPWNKGNNPRTAIDSWIVSHPEFTVDHDLHTKLMITGAPHGFLKRIS